MNTSAALLLRPKTNLNDMVIELTPGSLFHIPREPHDSWVVGDQPYVSLHFLGADHYAR